MYLSARLLKEIIKIAAVNTVVTLEGKIKEGIEQLFNTIWQKHLEELLSKLIEHDLKIIYLWIKR